MTRISLHDLLLEEYEDTERKEVGNEKKKSRKTFPSLTFLIRLDGFKYNRYCSIPIEGAKKLTLKHFIRYVVSAELSPLSGEVSSLFSLSPQHERVGRSLRQTTDVRIFYTDDENDDIFVGSDDEYKELIKIAAMKNKVERAVKMLDSVVIIMTFVLRKDMLWLSTFSARPRGTAFPGRRKEATRSAATPGPPRAK